MEQNKKFYKFIVFLIRPLLKIFFPYEVTGSEHAENLTGGYILCSNHLSDIDPAFLIAIHTNPICFMAKSELFKNKILSWFFLSLGAFSVKRGKGDSQAMDKAKQILRKGDIMGIFIEGTRSKTGEFLRPKSGAAVLSAALQVPVLPVCITGAGPCGKVRVFKKTLIKYNKPIAPPALDVDNISRSDLKAATNLIMDRIKEMRPLTGDR